MWNRYGRLWSVSSPRRWTSSVVKIEKPEGKPIGNEPVLGYLPGSAERAELEAQLCAASQTIEDIPIVIGDERIRDGEPRLQSMPHNHCRKIAQFYHASEKTLNRAIENAVKTQKVWDRTPITERISIFEKAADLIAGPYRQRLNAATMLGQSKTVIQAEIDSAAEIADFLRFNAHFLRENMRYQPISENSMITLNSIRFRGLEGFVAAIAPFNFTAIGGNLASAPAMMGNTVLWKPSDTAVLSNYLLYTVMREAGLPSGVINFVPSDGPTFGKTVTCSPDLAGINFTGSVPTFNWLWTAVADSLHRYRNYPRLLGECGGKNFHLIHPSAHLEHAVASTIRAAFEYCGQKCSACSRLFVPKSMWPNFKDCMVPRVRDLRVGDVSDFKTFMGAVIDLNAFNRIQGYIEAARANPNNEILCGGCSDCSYGYFIHPTVIQTTNPNDPLLTEEIFGPVLTVYVYDDKDLDKICEGINSTTKFALTGAVFAQDMDFLKHALEFFKYSAGNFYINDKSTGAVVGQQPFGGARMSGTNDKAGGPGYVLRWTSPQSIKETFTTPTEINYPYMKD